jgi:hypothetical protein
LFNYNTTGFTATAASDDDNPIVADFFSFGFKNDGLEQAKESLTKSSELKPKNQVIIQVPLKVAWNTL